MKIRYRFPVGSTVISAAYGVGTIQSIDREDSFPYFATFADGTKKRFTKKEAETSLRKPKH